MSPNDHLFITRQYYAYNGLFNSTRALYISTYSLVLNQVLGLPLAWLPWVLVANLLFTMLTEIPTGAFADIAGRRRSFLYAISLTGLGYLVYAGAIESYAPPVLMMVIVVVAELLLALGYTFYSGALEAWMVDLRADHDQIALKAVFSRGQLIKNLLYVAGGLVGIALFLFDLPWLSTFAVGASICMLLLLHGFRRMVSDKAPVVMPSERSPTIGLSTYTGHVRRSLIKLRTHPAITRLMVSAAVAFFVLQFVVFFWPLYLVQLLATDATSDRIGESAVLLAASWVLAYGARALGNAIPTLRILRKKHFMGILISLSVSSIAMLILAALTQLTGIVSIMTLGIVSTLLYGLVRFGEGVGDPLRQFLLNRLLDPRDRSTMLSLNSTLSMLVSAVGLTFCAFALQQGATVPILLSVSAIAQLATLALYYRVLSSKVGHAHAPRGS
ncbi:MFS transporter [Candidatus Thiosymbion oneisti]|uniref:MFS transporter n=1 Tax=Candidatus Thiosymbion oneisti TaxID=589554 RepID=UPI000B7D3174|nr:MFS transporter [Candidatus Thiosymbion oneisti]